MLQYILAGLALGSIYAIASAGLVVTFVSTGVLNFAFGSMAFVIARFYYWLNTQHSWTTWDAALLSLLVMAPLFGILLYAVLFRFVRNRSTLVKIVVTIGLSVALPPIADLIFGAQSITTAPGLALSSDQPYHFLGTPVTTDQVITYGFVLFVVLAGTLILRFTRVGLYVRASVDSEAMTSLSGTNPGRVAVGVWAVSTMLAGLAGILVAPTNGLTPVGMATLMAAAFAAVVAARLRSLTGVVAISLAMGVVTDVVQEYLPPSSSFTAAIIPSIPFGFILIFLVVYLIRSGSVADEAEPGGPLDQAIRPANQDTSLAGFTADDPGSSRPSTILALLPLAVVAVVPLIFHGSPYWLGLVAAGLCYAVAFLSFTVVTGEGGMLWLSQIIFAGGGALAAAQFVSVWHVPVLLAIVFAGIIMAVVGAIIGLLTIRLGDLYVALVTLSFGLLVETLVFTLNQFSQGGLGVTINRPQFAGGDLAFSLLRPGRVPHLRRPHRQPPPVDQRVGPPGRPGQRGRLPDPRRECRPGQGHRGRTGRVRGRGRWCVPGHGRRECPTGLLRDVRRPGLAGGRGHARGPLHRRRSHRRAGLLAPARGVLVLRTGPLGGGPGHPVRARGHFGGQGSRRCRGPDGAAAPPADPDASARAPPGPSAGHRPDRRCPRSGHDAGSRDTGRRRHVSRAPGSPSATGGCWPSTRPPSRSRPGSWSVWWGRTGPARAPCSASSPAWSAPRTVKSGWTGDDVTHASPQLRAERGLARTFQHPEIFGGLTVRQHLVLAHRTRTAKRRIWSDLFTLGSLRSVDPEEKAVVDDLIDSLGLAPIANRLAVGLPLGVSRLVELGRALATSPTVLLLDEPSSGLDSTETVEFESTLRRIAGDHGVSVLIVEHDVELVMRLCRTIYVLDFGVVIAGGTPEEIRNDPQVRAAYLGEETVAGERRRQHRRRGTASRLDGRIGHIGHAGHVRHRVSQHPLPSRSTTSASTTGRPSPCRMRPSGSGVDMHWPSSVPTVPGRAAWPGPSPVWSRARRGA